ncbi:MAG: RES family NAD+ phosphorylase [Verrucomicrobiales bacterium]|nr:RES family NAD+ phosphorylase [Verrucomicrobiales bacterium]
MPAPVTNSDVVHGYRIVSPRWADDALSGEGARKFGGRWNSPGRAMVYLGGSRALAALEMLVHLTSPGSRSKPYQMIEVAIPCDLISDYPLSILPQRWRESPPTLITQEIGDDWLQSCNSISQLALRVPSTLIPEENNLLLNPLHRDFKKITSLPPTAFSFDTRLCL